jgi:hypothetical protein
MPDRGVGTTGRFLVGKAAPNLVDPDRMSADDRLGEVVCLLAAGFLRYRSARAVDGGEEDLDFLRTSSEVCHKPQSEGESL